MGEKKDIKKAHKKTQSIKKPHYLEDNEVLI